MDNASVQEERTEYSEDKLRELVLYIAGKSVEDPNYGATKLNKLLFFSDFLAYGLLGKAITGASYQRLPRGPAPRELTNLVKEMETSNEAFLYERPYFGYRQKRLLPNRPSHLEVFVASEIALVDQVIEILSGKNAAEVSELSHLQLGWKLAEDREDIPYESIFLSNEDPTQEDLRRALDLAEEENAQSYAV